MSTGIAPAFRDASFVTTFSLMGGGKSLDHIASFPRNYVLAMTREFKPAITVLDYHPQVTEVRHLFDVDSKVEELLKLRERKDKTALYFTGVTLDDATLMANRTEAALTVGNEGVTKEKGWDLWRAERSKSLEISIRLAERCKQAGLHFAVNGHIRKARTNGAGKFFRGGIDLATDLVETFTASCDFVGKIEDEPDRLFQPTVFFVRNHHHEWATKNRFGLPDRVPANTGEILRHAGYSLPRAVGMEFHEEWVEWLAGYLLQIFSNGAPMSRQNLQQVLPDPANKIIEVVKNPKHVRWIIRDAVDRAWLRRESYRSILSEVGFGTTTQ